MTDSKSIAPNDNFSVKHLLIALVLLLAMPLLHVVLGISTFLG